MCYYIMFLKVLIKFYYPYKVFAEMISKLSWPAVENIVRRNVGRRQPNGLTQFVDEGGIRKLNQEAVS